MRYRPEIDGLRAVAVLPVILFHAGLPGFSGGFVGVDVFFVISGYLITRLIWLELTQRRFSILDFYERRARRILPALFVVLLASLPMAWLWLPPSDMQDFCDSVVAVATYTSNFLFWSQSGYWDTASELKPLLHTWSLAVEEQFYLLFPALMLLCHRLGKGRIILLLATLSALSLGLSIWAARYAPSFGFYLLPTRVWELGMGALLALGVPELTQRAGRNTTAAIAAQTLPVIGLAAIVTAVFSFDHRTPFPGVHALLPTLGAALIIAFAQPQTLLGRVLAWRPIVLIGLVSYSAYLWHYVLFAFARHHAMEEPSSGLLLGLSVASLVLAWLSWRWIEQPFRDRKRFRRAQIFGFALLASAAFIGTGLVGTFSHGFVSRSSIQANSDAVFEHVLDINPGLDARCEGNAIDEPACRTSDRPEILVWGDSYAMHLVDGIVASQADVQLIQMTLSVCGPIFDRAPWFEPGYEDAWGQDCLAFNDAVRTWLQGHPGVRFAVLSSPFTQYLKAGWLDQDGVRHPIDTASAQRAFLQTLGTLESLGVTPIVFSPPPSNGKDLGRCVLKAKWQGLDPDQCNFDIKDMSNEVKDANAFLQIIANHYHVIFMETLLCPQGHCITHLGGIPIYRDSGHFSRAGAAAIGRKWDFYTLITQPTDHVSERR
ncbi:MAG TPA: acyltransferase family protein [Chiayiivirga sp.]|nr:acyltransferase family protein [Chiayiivirga sp.]